MMSANTQQQESAEYNSSLKLGEPAAAAVFDQERGDDGSASDHSRRSREPLSVAKSAELNRAQTDPKVLVANSLRSLGLEDRNIPLGDLEDVELFQVEPEDNYKPQKADPVFPICTEGACDIKVPTVDNSGSQDSSECVLPKTVIPQPHWKGQDVVINHYQQPLLVAAQQQQQQQQPLVGNEVDVTSSNSSSLGAAGSKFEILAIRDNPDSDDSSQASSVPDSSQTKYPQQVEDTDQATVDNGYADLMKGQIQSTFNTNRLQSVSVPENKIKEVGAGAFPQYEDLNNETGRLLYSASTENNLKSGEVYVLQDYRSGFLERGGNGAVFQYALCGKEYAMKLTDYRERELNIWSTLEHPNILPLLGVMIGSEYQRCYQLMPLMSGDLRKMMISHGTLQSLSQQLSDKTWNIVIQNTKYVLRETLKGLIYLDRKNIQHGDMKARNILVLKKCACFDILRCTCDDLEKYLIQISDFDSSKQTTFSRKPGDFALCKDPMSSKQMERVKGTLAYRAPEQFKSCPIESAEYKRVLTDGEVRYNMEGPWCDVWSVGVMLLQMVLGSGCSTTEANMITHYNVKAMHPIIEDSVAIIRLTELLQLHLPQLRPLEDVACACLKIDCGARSTAKQVLEKLD